MGSLFLCQEILQLKLISGPIWNIFLVWFKIQTKFLTLSHDLNRVKGGPFLSKVCTDDQHCPAAAAAVDCHVHVHVVLERGRAGREVNGKMQLYAAQNTAPIHTKYILINQS